MNYDAVKSFYVNFFNYQDTYNRGYWRQYRNIATNMVTDYLVGSENIAVLDLGGGAMFSLPELVEDERVSRYDVVDIVIKVNSEIKKINLTENNIKDYLESYDGCRYDVVIIFGVLEYLTKVDAIEVLRMLPRVMLPDAKVLLHEPNYRAEKYLDKTAGTQQSVEIEGMLKGSALKIEKRSDYHLIWLRRIADLVPLKPSWIYKILLSLEHYVGGGVDSLYILSLNDA